MRRRPLLAATLGGLATPALAQPGFPNRPIRVVSPFSAGGTSDGVIRAMNPVLERLLGHPMVIDNRPGAGGTVGTAHVAGERPDGYTLVLANAGPLAIAATLFPRLAYNLGNSFTYISLVGGAPILCAVNPAGPIRSLAAYRQAAAARPEAMTYGSAGIGSVGHLAGLLWAREAGVEMLHLPFRGGGEAEIAMLGGNIGSIWNTLGAHAGSVRGGTIRPIAQTADRRVPAFPDIPSIVEAGFPNAVAINWFVLAGPAGLPPEITARIRGAFSAALADPATAERVAGFGLVPMGDPEPAAIRDFVTGEAARWAPVVRASGAEPS
ncbi:MAG: tripartite tricarboxylate transporter substrate binding protein [Rubritepida sp.]|jgi:tripartite-type tricarboxylate transporter receptor subunit TctC|nr:tripartite tricarboxylate transporter substrate binding protein [Rubritepida sp.]